MKSTKWYPVVGLLALIAMICSGACDPSSTPIPPPTLIPTSEPTETPNKRLSLIASPPIICRPCPTAAISTPTSTTIDLAAAPLASPGTGELQAPGGEKQFSKIPSIVQATIDKFALDGQPVYDGLMPSIDHEGRILLDFHSAGAVGPTEKADLENLDAIVVSSSADLVWPDGMSAPEGWGGIIAAWVPHGQVETAAALPWVTVVRPVFNLPPDEGP